MSDPASVSPEIIIKAFLNPELNKVCKPLIVEDFSWLKTVSSKLQVNVKLHSVKNVRMLSEKPGVINVVDL